MQQSGEDTLIFVVEQVVEVVDRQFDFIAEDFRALLYTAEKVVAGDDFATGR